MSGCAARAMRRVIRAGRRHAWIVVSASTCLGWAADAAAQATTVITPSVSVGAAYDDNVLWQPEAQSDHVYRIVPGLSFTRDTVRSHWLGSATVQGEWYSRYRDLSTPAATQHADAAGQWQTSPRTTISLTSGYDNTNSPADLNLTTGLVPGRVRAWRWLTGPQIATTVQTGTTVTVAYQAMGEYSAITPGVITHEADAGVSQHVDARDDLRVRYIGQVFAFVGARAIISNTALFGWTRKLSPALQVRADAGARYAEGRARPEIDAAVTRHATFTDLSLDYTWTETTALGVASLVDVQRVAGSWRYQRPGHVSLSLQGGVYRNDFGSSLATVYSGSVETVAPLFGPVSLALAYEIDDQQGRFATILVPTTTSPIGLGDLTPGPVGLQNVRRSITFVRLIVSGSIRHSGGPELPPDQPAGQPASQPIGQPAGQPVTGRPQ